MFNFNRDVKAGRGSLCSGGCIPDAAVDAGFVVAHGAVVSFPAKAGAQCDDAADRLNGVHQGGRGKGDPTEAGGKKEKSFCCSATSQLQ